MTVKAPLSLSVPVDAERYTEKEVRKGGIQCDPADVMSQGVCTDTRRKVPGIRNC